MLERYLLKELLTPLSAWAAFLAFTFLVVALLQGAEVLLGSAVGWVDLVRILLYLLPQLLTQALPVAFLLAILLGLGRLAEDGELRAMQSLGIDPARLFLTPLLLGLALTATQVGLGFTLQPWGLQAASAQANEIIRRNLMTDMRPGLFHEEVQGFTFYAERHGPDGGWEHVLLFDERDPATPLLLVARRGVARPLAGSGDLTFALEEGSVHQAKRTSGEYATLTFAQADVHAGLGEARHLRNRFAGSFEAVAPTELLAESARARARGEADLPFLTAFHWRVGQLLMPLAFALLGAPLAVLRRTGRTWGFVFTLVGFALYYVLARSGAQAAVTGQVPPLVGGQLANAVFLVVGCGLMAWHSRRGAA